MTTSAVGTDERWIEKVSEPPDSVVIRPPRGEMKTPGVSSSSLTQSTSSASSPLYLASALVAGAVTTEYGWLPSASASSTPVTVTTCEVSQSALVNVSDAGETVPSEILELESPMVTSAVGCEFRKTSNVAESASSVVRSLPVTGSKGPSGMTVIPAVSSFWFVTETSGTTMPLT